jgi:hypothetical protein
MVWHVCVRLARKPIVAYSAAALFVALACAASPAAAQVKVEDLIGKAVPDITDAIEKPVEQAIKLFSEGKFDDARNLLKETRVRNPQLPPEGVIMAQLMVSINQGISCLAIWRSRTDR